MFNNDHVDKKGEDTMILKNNPRSKGPTRFKRVLYATVCAISALALCLTALPLRTVG